MRKFIDSKASLSDFKANYILDDNVLGSGYISKVFKGTDKQNPKFKVAVKVFNKDKLSNEDDI